MKIKSAAAEDIRPHEPIMLPFADPAGWAVDEEGEISWISSSSIGGATVVAQVKTG